MRLRIFTLSVLVSFSAPIFANPLSWTGYVKGEELYNSRGGLKTGSIFNGVGQLKAIYDCDAAKTWQGGQFTIGALGIAETHNPSKYSAELQSASNLSANSELRLSNLSFEQKFNPQLTGRVGIMDLNDYFNVTEQAVGLLNASFGISPSLTANTQTNTYPYPGFGAMLDRTSDIVGTRIGLFQGNPKRQTTVFNKGSMILAEVYKSINIFTFKGGIWHYQQSDSKIGASNSGVYVIAQTEWKNANGKPRGAFLQFGSAPKTSNTVLHTVGVGFVADALSLGLTQVFINDVGYETIYEATYAFEITKQLTLNPDIQYIVHPAGKYRNAVVGIIRLSFTF